jgi:hypothetical protein
MKLLKKATFAIVLAVIYGTAFPCIAQQKAAITTFEEQAPFKVSPVYFQEWYAGIKVGGTGINIFLPITNVAENVQIEHVYFRNLTGELNIKEGKYYALLKNKSPHYTFKKAEAPTDYPFTLKDNECAVSYVENGITKYVKIAADNEVAGTYYENGPPSIYSRASSSGMASLDEEDDND